MSEMSDEETESPRPQQQQRRRRTTHRRVSSHMLNQELGGLLTARQVTLTQLADMIFAGRAALTLVLNGRRIGRHTWPKLARVLTKQEYDCAREFAARNLADTWAAGHADANDADAAPHLVTDDARRFILAQKTRHGADDMRLPKSLPELRGWSELQNKTKHCHVPHGTDSLT